MVDVKEVGVKVFTGKDLDVSKLAKGDTVRMIDGSELVISDVFRFPYQLIWRVSGFLKESMDTLCHHYVSRDGMVKLPHIDTRRLDVKEAKKV